jgi:hypothetical protein
LVIVVHLLQVLIVNREPPQGRFRDRSQDWDLFAFTVHRVVTSGDISISLYRYLYIDINLSILVDLVKYYFPKSHKDLSIYHDITSASKHLKGCHAGLDPASSLLNGFQLACP